MFYICFCLYHIWARNFAYSFLDQQATEWQLVGDGEKKGQKIDEDHRDRKNRKSVQFDNEKDQKHMKIESLNTGDKNGKE